MIKKNQNCIVLLILTIFIASSTGCGTISGYTKPVTIKPPAVSSSMPAFSLGMVDYDEGKMLEQNTTPFKWKGARFSEQDLNNISLSLQKAIPLISGSLEELFINMIVRANLIAYSNGEVAILSAVGWCVSDVSEKPVFEDNFYVATYHAAPTMFTLGGVKEEIMEKVVSRIILTCVEMNNGNTAIRPVPVKDVYDSYGAAVATLPANITFINPLGGVLTGIHQRYATDWHDLGTMKALAWDAILKGTK